MHNKCMGLYGNLSGGSKTLEIQVGGELNLKKSSAGIILTDSSHDLNNQFSDTSALSDPENSRNISFTYFSPDINPMHWTNLKAIFSWF